MPGSGNPNWVKGMSAPPGAGHPKGSRGRLIATILADELSIFRGNNDQKTIITRRAVRKNNGERSGDRPAHPHNHAT